MRLIDVDALMSQAFSTRQGYDAVLVEDIVNEPTVEANPIINAQWELVRYDPDYLLYSARCTNCKKVHESNDNVAKLPFCPHCGAQMNGEKMPVLIISGEEEQ